MAEGKVGAIIAAAGESRRMAGVDKIFTSLRGKPVLAHSVDAFERCSAINQIVVVVSSQNVGVGEQLVAEEGWTKVTKVCTGGMMRQDSVLVGLKRLGKCQWVVIHDGARPLVSTEIIEQGLEAAEETGAAIAAVPVTDTIKVAGEYRMVRYTPPRHNLWIAQTPQVFRYDIINQAYKQAQEEVTDDATLVEQMGYRVKLYMGAYDNTKITTPEDLALMEVRWPQFGE